MTPELLSIGREILDGRVLDTNSVRFSLALKKKGLVPRYAQKVDDDPERMMEAFAIAQKRSTLVLVTGGLGPTSDDLTTEVFSEFVGAPLRRSSEALAQIEAFFARLGRKMIPVQFKQADFPEGARILRNTQGSAPGFHFNHQGVDWFFFPGVPRELETMLETEALPLIKGVPSYRSIEWSTHFTSEGELQTRLSKIESTLGKDFEITYRTRYPENHIGLHGAPSDDAGRTRFLEAERAIDQVLSTDVFSKNQASLERVVIEAATSKKTWVAAAESCTGGLVSERLTNVAGSSAVFFAGYVTYDNAAKTDLGVPPDLIEKHGAVSDEVARALAEAALAKTIASGKRDSLAVSTTGIAGPGGGSPEKPLGLCFVALARTGHPTESWRVQAPRSDDRALNRIYFSQFALDRLRLALM